MRRELRITIALAVLALGIAPANAQEPSPRITLIELTPHLAVNDAAALIEAEKYADAIVILDGFIAIQSEQVPEAIYLLGLAHYKLGDYAKAPNHAELAATLASDAPLSWLELDADNFRGTVRALPTREDVTMPIQEQLIVELYSK